MRGSGWLLPALALLLWLGAIGWPALAAAGAAASEPPASDALFVAIRSPVILFLETTLYAAGIALAAMLAGWAPGRVLGRALERGRFVTIATLVLLPMCLPAYAVTYAWWQAWPADSPLHAWAVAHRAVPLLRQATLVLGLACWSWPLVAWCVATTGAGARDDLLRLDGAGPLRRLGHVARADARGLALGGLLVFLLAFNNTTCFDLAQVFTFGNELRAKEALGAPPRSLLIWSLPFVVPVAAVAVLMWWPLAARPRRRAERAAPSPGARTAAALVWAASVLVPFALLTAGVVGKGRLAAFDDLYRGALFRDAGRAATSAALAMIVAAGLALAWGDHRRWVRGVAHAQALGWLLFALVPGTVIGVALEAAYNRAGGLDAIYRGPAILAIAHLARFGVVAALLARWVAVREPAALADLRRTDGAGTLAGGLAAGGPALAALAAATLALTFVLALGEVPVTAAVHPPGSDPLVMRLLNDMHYQRPQAVMVALLGLLAVALAAALACAVLAPRLTRRPRGAAAALLALGLALGLVVAPGCGPADPDGAPLRPRVVFGSNGTALGQFSYPRCIAADAARGSVYIVDKTARVQRFDVDGRPEHQWRTPEKENGKPTGVSVAPDGRVFVADTHYHRVIAYDADGNEQLRFGRYGEGPGEFIYPTCVAFGPEGRLYVSEYGGHDRIQVFSPAGAYLFEFGALGAGPGQFDRPQSMAFNPERSELFVADACNHRIVVVDAGGGLLRSFGGPGTGRGELHYPYGIDLLPDGTLVVAEFGNNRVQRFSPDGESLGVFGRLGAGEGELRYPWDVAVIDRTVFILDSGNNRVQTIRIR